MAIQSRVPVLLCRKVAERQVLKHLELAPGEQSRERVLEQQPWVQAPELPQVLQQFRHDMPLRMPFP
jgi:hypothetical protein